MTDIDKSIEDAINAYDVERARILLKDALKAPSPSAHIFYLASRVAIDDAQKAYFLKKSLEVDPFYQLSTSDLTKSHPPQNIVVQMPMQSAHAESNDSLEKIKGNIKDLEIKLDLTYAEIDQLQKQYVIFLGFMYAGLFAVLLWLIIVGLLAVGVGIIGFILGIIYEINITEKLRVLLNTASTEFTQLEQLRIKASQIKGITDRFDVIVQSKPKRSKRSDYSFAVSKVMNLTKSRLLAFLNLPLPVVVASGLTGDSAQKVKTIFEKTQVEVSIRPKI